MNERTARIRLEGPTPLVEIGGLDVSAATVSLRLEAQHSHRTGLVLDLLLHEAVVEGQTQVSVPDETARALVALGWTPPGDQPPGGWLEEALRSRVHRAAVAEEVRRLARIDQVWARSIASDDTGPHPRTPRL
ncbi:hypothetical protein ACRAR1_07065 [Streptomyces sanyensis]|uniref:hypothetical protein n=1 Tax=Streptomyces sanyensis TaxID=568869 RepID=UPI003D76D39D